MIGASPAEAVSCHTLDSGGSLPLCRDAVCVFSSSSRKGFSELDELKQQRATAVERFHDILRHVWLEFDNQQNIYRVRSAKLGIFKCNDKRLSYKQN